MTQLFDFLHSSHDDAQAQPSCLMFVRLNSPAYSDSPQGDCSNGFLWKKEKVMSVLIESNFKDINLLHVFYCHEISCLLSVLSVCHIVQIVINPLTFNPGTLCPTGWIMGTVMTALHLFTLIVSKLVMTTSVETNDIPINLRYACSLIPRNKSQKIH